MPGLSSPPGFARTMRALIVRVVALTSGSSAATLPLKTCVRKGRSAPLHFDSGPDQRGLRFRHLGIDPDCPDRGELEQGHARADRHAFARAQLPNESSVGCMQCDAWVRLTVALDGLNLFLGDTEQLESLARRLG